MSSSTLRRIVLVGLMGSGKTAVGREIAKRIGWTFLDFDEEIEVEVGTTVAEMFETRGEAYFRSIEERVANKLLSREGVVLGSGGGWAAEPGRLDGLPSGTETFWLRVTAEEAVRRASRHPEKRPLLAGSDPLGAALKLLAERTPQYECADWTVDTVGLSVEDVATQISEILEQRYPKTRTV